MTNQRRIALLLLALAAAAIAGRSTGGEGKPQDREGVYFILDASRSMGQPLDDGIPRLDAARDAVLRFAAESPDDVDVAIRVFGDRNDRDCADSRLLLPFTRPSEVASRLESRSGLAPRGQTPISYSLRRSLHDFGTRGGELVLITDGVESCREDPCALLRRWMKQDVGVRVHVVGLGVDAEARSALQCISREAATSLVDASTTDELTRGMQRIRDELDWTTFTLRGLDASGEVVRIEGELVREGAASIAVASHRRNKVPPGVYRLHAGVRTANGTLYKPVERRLKIAPRKRAVDVTVTVADSPRVRARFMANGRPQQGSTVHAFRDGREVFAFDWFEEVPVDEGLYEFRTELDAQNALSLEQRIDGDSTEIVFELTPTVHVKIRMVAASQGRWFRKNYELWQNGEKRYDVHLHEGVVVLPGTYDVKLPDALTPWTHRDLEITTEPEQSYELEVPVGYVTVRYLRPDGSPDHNRRCFIGPGENGQGFYRKSGEKISLTPGTYNVVGWGGDYDPVVFEVQAGDQVEIVLQGKTE